MMRYYFYLPIVFTTLLIITRRTLAEPNDAYNSWKGFSISCLTEDESTTGNASSCHGIKIVRKIVQKMLEEARRNKNLEIIDGVSLVMSGNEENTGLSSRNARVLTNLGQIGKVVSFLENRELRVKLGKLLPDNFEDVVNASLASIDQGRGHGNKGGGKKGDNGMMMMVLMMGKMMAAMGFGALGLMAMKALMLSSIALMLSLIVAAKKLVSKDDESHHVVYAQEHHRRKRGLLNVSLEDLKNQPYRGYLVHAN